jgi:hypothetical protein
MYNKSGGHMENRLILAYKSSRYEHRNFYLGDEILAKKALGEFIDYILEKLLECPNVEYSKCSTWWKHDDCNKLMEILFELTNDQSYKAEFGISVASNTANKQLNLWD